MRFIGDVHSKFDEYLKIISKVDKSIQVGDFGAGFRDLPAVSNNHRFIRGNHDSPEICKTSPNWIPDSYSEERMFFFGGGFSRDRDRRTEGKDWWADEELSFDDIYKLIDQYEKLDTDILVCHECPEMVVNLLFGSHIGHDLSTSRTRQALDSLIYIRPPKIVIHGHWHIDSDREINDIRFVSLGELSFIDLDI